MHRTLIDKIPVLILTVFFLQPAVTFSQAKGVTELSISKCWAYPTDSASSGIASEGSRVYLGGEGATVEALSIDGKKIWATELGGEIRSNFLPTESGLLLATLSPGPEPAINGGMLRSLSLETGITNWTAKLPEAARYFIAQHNGSAIVVALSGSIYAVDVKSGEIRWKRDVADGFAAEPFFSADTLVVAARGNQIFTILLATGEISAMRKSRFGVTAVAEMQPGNIIVGDERGNVSTLNGSDKPTWKFKSGGEISRVYVVGDYILAASHDNFIYYLLARNGDVEWKKRLAGRILHTGNIGGRYVLTMSVDETTVPFLDLTNGKTVGQLLFADKETLTSLPVSAGGSILLRTNIAVYSYSLNGCKNQSEPSALSRRS